MSNYDLGKDKKGMSGVNSRLKLALRNGTNRGLFKQVRGGAKGANGSFKLASQVMAEEVVEEAQFL